MVGLNIESGCLQAVSISVRKRQVEDIAFCELDIDQDAAVSLPEGFKELLLVPPLKNDKDVCISVGGEGVVVRYLSIENSPKENIDTTIQKNFESRIPFKKEEVYTDYQILGKGREKKFTKVALVAAQKSLVNEKVGLAAAAGLSVKAVETESTALLNEWFYNNQGKDNGEIIGLLNIGFDTTNFNIVYGQAPLLSRDIKFGILPLLKIASKNNNLKISENLKLFRGTNFLKEGPFFSWLEGNIDHLSEEIKLSFEYSKNQVGRIPSKIYLAGHLKEISGLSDVLAEILGVEIFTYNPFSNINVAQNFLEAIKNNEPRFATTVGLSLHD
ncbi:MAG: pilus assembly protein PilM [Candidatus Ratteibacteria bacterium]|jgi:type IV pilus assembly protein PilM